MALTKNFSYRLERSVQPLVRELTPFSDYLDYLLSRLEPLPAVVVPVDEALGCVLAADVTAPLNLPHFNNSAMDGYAVRTADFGALEPGTACEITLTVAGDVPAGSGANPPLTDGQCVRIMTGAAVPDDADAIVPLEHTFLGLDATASLPDTITVLRVPKFDACIRHAGEDTREGAIIADAGTQIGARLMAALCACGVAEVCVHPRPKVAIISTGDELVPAGTKDLARGQIHDSNSPLLAALAHKWGADVTGIHHCSDKDEKFLAALETVREKADVIITTGGISVGVFDVVRLTLEKSGWDMHFDKVAMQPGKPQGFGSDGRGTTIITLPGNPVSAFVSFEAFVRPALHKLAGRRGPVRVESRRKTATGWSCPKGRLQILPVAVQPDGTITPSAAGGSGSHLVGQLGLADALALVPMQRDEVHEGDTLTCWEIIR